MNPDSEIELDFPPFFRVYKGGRFEDLHGTGVDVQGTDEATSDIPSEDVTIDANTTARIYRPGLTDTAQSKLPILIYFHGGAFLFGSYSMPTYDNHLRILVSRAQLVAVSVDYRLANQARLPAAYEDSWAALKWVVSRAHPWLAEHGDFDHMFVAGDSAGANITHHLALQAGVEGVKIKGVGLIHPYFWGEKRIESETWLPIVRETIRTLWTMVMPEEEGWDLDHHWINPLHEGAPSLAGLGARGRWCAWLVSILSRRGGRRIGWRRRRASGEERQSLSNRLAGIAFIWRIRARMRRRSWLTSWLLSSVVPSLWPSRVGLHCTILISI